MNTPNQLWESYRDMVYENGHPPDEVEFEARRAFFAGSEAVFKLLESWSDQDLSGNEAGILAKRYREENKAAAMETVPDDEQEETL